MLKHIRIIAVIILLFTSFIMAETETTVIIVYNNDSDTYNIYGSLQHKLKPEKNVKLGDLLKYLSDAYPQTGAAAELMIFFPDHEIVKYNNGFFEPTAKSITKILSAVNENSYFLLTTIRYGKVTKDEWVTLNRYLKKYGLDKEKLNLTE